MRFVASPFYVAKPMCVFFVPFPDTLYLPTYRNVKCATRRIGSQATALRFAKFLVDTCQSVFYTLFGIWKSVLRTVQLYSWQQSENTKQVFKLHCATWCNLTNPGQRSCLLVLFSDETKFCWHDCFYDVTMRTGTKKIARNPFNTFLEMYLLVT